MLQKYKTACCAYLNRYTAFRGRSFSFQLFTLVAIAASVLIITNSIYRQLVPRYKTSYPVALTATVAQKIK